jgi:hypothetical protein
MNQWGKQRQAKSSPHTNALQGSESSPSHFTTDDKSDSLSCYRATIVTLDQMLNHGSESYNVNRLEASFPTRGRVCHLSSVFVRTIHYINISLCINIQVLHITTHNFSLSMSAKALLSRLRLILISSATTAA